MSDTLKGKIYEIITIIAIKRFTNLIKQGESLFWNVKPKNINIEPDITIGPDPESPRILILVTHTIAGSASQKKHWRNMGEFVDSRLQFGNKIKILSIVFDSSQKRRLANVTDIILDGTIEVDRKEYGSRLISWASLCAEKYENYKESTKEKAVKIELDAVRSKSITLIKQMGTDIDSISKGNSTQSIGWYAAFNEVQKNRSFKRVPPVRPFYLRRGLGRLLPIANREFVFQMLEAFSKRESVPEIPLYLQQMGLVQRGIPGYSCTMVIKRGKVKKPNELYHITDYLTPNTLIELWQSQRSSSEALLQVCDEISNNCSESFYNFILNHFETLCVQSVMKKALIDCFNNPSNILNDGAISASVNGRAWLFDYLMTVIKAFTGKQQGYGYSKLVIDTNLYIPGKRSILDFALPKYNKRTEMLPEYILDKVSKVLSEKLSTIGRNWIETNSKIISTFYLQGLFEDKIYKMDAFDPVFQLIYDKIGNLQINPRYSTLLSELLNSQNSTCYVAQSKSTIIMWQSAYDSTNKFKELMGRIGMLRTKLTNDKIVPRIEIKRVLLVIDGTWSENHLTCLNLAGFDGIYYPDELDELKAAII